MSQGLERCGCYLRFYSADSEERDAIVLDFRCEVCRAHTSVIPENMSPYRRLPSSHAQHYGDQQSRLDPASAKVPLDDEDTEYLFPQGRQRRIMQSFWSAFCLHAIYLAGNYGFQLDSSPESVWRQLRQAGTVRKVLVALAGHQTSLTKNYLSLKPWWQGGLARGWRCLSARAP